MPSTVEGYPHGRVPRAVRERQILTLAEELFAERGYDGASMDELARRAGVTKPVVYDLVANKEALFRRCFERAGAELAARVAAAAGEHEGDLEAELRAGAQAFLAFIDEHEDAFSMLLSVDTGGRTEQALSEIRARQAALVTAQLLRHSPRLDPRRAELVAHALNGAHEAVAHWRRTHPDLSSGELGRWLADFVVPGALALVRGQEDPQ